MPFVHSIAHSLENFFNIASRASRMEFLCFAAFLISGALVSALADVAIYGMSLGLLPLCVIFSLVMIVPMAALVFRRLHDVDKSAWWLLIVLVPVIGACTLIWFLLRQGTVGSNRFGSAPLDEAEPTLDLAFTPAQ